VPKKLNADQKRARRVGELGVFLRQYARKAQKNLEPNDRRYDRAVAKQVQQMSPEELDRLLRDDEGE
jgi:hypothetical protein